MNFRRNMNHAVFASVQMIVLCVITLAFAQDSVPPKEAIIVEYPSRVRLEGVIGPYKLGQSLMLGCEGLGGYPKPSTMWTWRSEGQRKGIINGSILSLSSLERGDQWSHYTCTAQNTNMTAPKSVTVIIEIFLPPSELLLQGNIHPPFMAGQNVQISCLSFGSYPKAHIQWKKNDEVITSEEKITEHGNITTSVFEFIAQPWDNNRKMECLAMNPDLPTEILQREFIVKVHYKPEVKIIILSNQSQIAETQNLVLLCSLKANPEPFNVLWYFEDKEFINDSSVVALYNKLYIKNLTLSHSGKYSCLTSNIYGSDSATVSVTVKHKPVCRQAQEPCSFSPEIDDLNVTCNLSSYPSNVTFYWTLGNISSNSSWSSGQVPHTSVKLRNSSSELFCWGRNEIGLQEFPCRIMLKKVSKKTSLFLPVLSLSIFFIISVLIGVFIVIRKYKLNFNASSNTSSHHEMLHLKDHSCGKLLSKCVEQASDCNRTDCSSKLLQPIT